MPQVARVIQLDDYRRRRRPQPAPQQPPPTALMPVWLVWVPVLLVP